MPVGQGGAGDCHLRPRQDSLELTWLTPWEAASDAVSLAYVVPVTGTCDPRQDALELTWMTPQEAASDVVSAEMEGGRGALVRAALASVGRLY